MGVCSTTTPSMKQRVFQIHVTMTTLDKARPRKGGRRANGTSVSESVKWTEKAPNLTLPSGAGGRLTLASLGVPERPAWPSAPDHGRAQALF